MNKIVTFIVVVVTSASFMVGCNASKSDVALAVAYTNMKRDQEQQVRDIWTASQSHGAAGEGVDQ
jgi:hypothetical protein